MKQHLIHILLVAFLLSGCGSSQQREDAPNEDAASSQKVSGPRPKVDDRSAPHEEGLLVTYSTGEDNVEWPHYDMPLIHQLPVPEVPESIEGPTEQPSSKHSQSGED